MFEDDFFTEGNDGEEDLISRFEKLKNGEPAGFLDEDEFEHLIEFFFQSGEEVKALQACEIATVYYPFSSSILLLKAEILTHTLKYGQALKVLDTLEQYDCTNLDAVLLRSDILMSQFKHDQAALYLEQQMTNFDKKERLEILLELSDVYDESEEFDAVFDTLKRVIGIDKRNEEALQKICFWAEFTGRLQESIEFHNQLIENDPYNSLAWFNLGAAFQSLKLYEKCLDAYQYCIAIDENFEFAYRNMADAFMRIKNYEGALDVLNKHLEIAKPEDVIFEAMGFCWEKKKDFTKARFFYRQASQLSPQDDNIFYKIGETYARERQWEKAVKSFSVALHLDKENASYCMAIGNCLMELNVKSEALVCYLNAVRLKPGNKSTWIALIRGLYLSGHFEEVIIQLEVARQHCGDKSDFNYFHAAALFELGKVKEGLLKLEEGLQNAPKRCKIFTELNPEFLLRSSVYDLISKYRKK